MDITQTFSISNQDIANAFVHQHGSTIKHVLLVGGKCSSYLFKKDMECSLTLNGKTSERKVQIDLLLFIDNAEEGLQISTDVIYLTYQYGTDKLFLLIEDEQKRTEICDCVKEEIIKLMREE